MLKYEVLLRILDELCEEAPVNFKSYHPDNFDVEKVRQARSKAYIHLFLKVKCGVMGFRDRHDLITDGSQDGGLDAYFIDRQKKRLYLIQSKLWANPSSFEEKSISADELVKMEVSRILKGETTDSNGNEFNSKVKAFQEQWRNVTDHAHYEYIVVILGNLTKYNDEQVRRLIDHSQYIIFDFRRTFDELVFPLCSGTYYDPNEIIITINLGDKEQSTLKQKITTKYGKFNVRVIFVPVEEVGRILAKYKNSLLKYNPRNYLSLSRNKVNRSIRDSIVNTKTNDFAILNNGITLICDSFRISESTGNVDVGQILITNPQIINGGQTAYTLSKLYEMYGDWPEDVFMDKEVLLKAIIIGPDESANLDNFIGEISNATNQQSRVEEADRRANEPIQVQLQKLIYDHFGYFYERKRGEFFNGLDNGYIDSRHVIDRYNFLRAYLAFKGQPRWARQRGSETLFKYEYFRSVLDDSTNFREMVFSYFTLVRLHEIEKESNDASWGWGLRYGKMAVISAIAYTGLEGLITRENLHELIQASIAAVKPRWRQFEHWVRNKPENSDYIIEDFDFDNYYKGKTVNNDVREFFGA